MITEERTASPHGAARDAGVRLQLLTSCHQAADHPIHPAMPETEYLKGFLCRVARPGRGS